jgi:hypothetical protein
MWVIAKGEPSERDDKSVESLESYVCRFACRRKFMKLGIAWLSELRDETRISREDWN